MHFMLFVKIREFDRMTRRWKIKRLHFELICIKLDITHPHIKCLLNCKEFSSLIVNIFLYLFPIKLLLLQSLNIREKTVELFKILLKFIRHYMKRHLHVIFRFVKNTNWITTNQLFRSDQEQFQIKS